MQTFRSNSGRVAEDKTSRAGSSIRKPEERVACVLGEERGVCSRLLQREEPSEAIPRFSSWPCPSPSVSRQTSKHSVDTRSCLSQLSFENRVAAGFSETKRGMLWIKHGTASLLRKRLTVFPGVEPRYDGSTVHNRLWKALF